MCHWRKYLVDGFAILFPFVLTIVLVDWLVDFFTYPLHLWLSHVVHHKIILKLIGFLLTIVFITLFGFLVRRWLLAQVMGAIHRLFLHIPFVKKIYKSCYQAISALFKEKERAFSAVVTFEYGDTNGMVVGLVPRKENIFEEHIPILHTGPSPLHNLILFVDKKNLNATSIPIDVAIRWSVSAGSAPLTKSSNDI